MCYCSLIPGLSDTVVVSQVVHSLQAYYSYFMDASRIETSYDVNSEHCLPTLDYGEACLTLSSPYLGKCGYDGAGAAFATLYGGSTLQSRVAAYDESRLFTFDQTPFIVGKHTSIAEVGYIYVPKACENTKVSRCSETGAGCCVHHFYSHPVLVSPHVTAWADLLTS